MSHTRRSSKSKYVLYHFPLCLLYSATLLAFTDDHFQFFFRVYLIAMYPFYTYHS